MRVSECMTEKVAICSPDESIEKVAARMAELDCGVVPLAEDDKLVGVITDRDIAVRGVAHGKGPGTAARDVMSNEVLYCFEDQDLAEVSDNMAELKIRRMPVVDRNKNLVGILSLGDIALGNGRAGADTIQEISLQGGPHSQSAA